MTHMSKDQARDRVAELSGELRRHNRLYYSQARPEISDAQYDRLLAELRALEERFSQLRASDSPTQTVGAAIATSFAPVTHFKPMLSLDSSADAAMAQGFLRRLERIKADSADLLVQPKIDGLSVELDYRQGLLHTGSTRGDGTTGEDITPNLREVDGIPGNLSGQWPQRVVVRGEVYMDRAGFIELNRGLVQAGKEPFANPRNAAAGSLRQQDPLVSASRPLSFFAFELVNAPELGVKSDRQANQLMAGWGFDAHEEHWQIGRGLDFLAASHQAYLEQREHLSFEIDGMVIKPDEFKWRELLPSKARHPLWAFAWKFPPRQEITILRGIAVQVGRSGKLTPVALLDAVDVGGVTVSRASLHNFDELDRLKVRVGDRVRIERAGDVIPKVAAVLEDVPAPPPQCPACGAKTERAKNIKKVAIYRVNKNISPDQEIFTKRLRTIEEDGVDYICPNKLGCPAQIERSLVHFASRLAMDIEGLGPGRVRGLREAGLIDNVVSLYCLKDKRDSLADLKGWGDQSTDKLLDAIENSRGKALNRFYFGLGIPNIGEITAMVLAQRFKDLESLFGADKNELKKADLNTAQVISLTRFLANQANQAQLYDLFSQVKPGEVRRPVGGKLPFSDMSVVVTGKLITMTRQEATAVVQSQGGRAVSAVSKNTAFVVAGPAAKGKKIDRARQLNIPIVSEEEFLKRAGVQPRPSSDIEIEKDNHATQAAGEGESQLALGLKE